MKILSVISALHFPGFTRRATIEAISRKVQRLDLLMYTGLKNRFKKKVSVEGIPLYTYHFWVPDKVKESSVFTNIEHTLRSSTWSKRFSDYDVIFFTDPNQAYLLPYIYDQKVVYLIRDPNVLQSKKNILSERRLIDRADLILATSKNLAAEYLPKYHETSHPNVQYWPNCVDLNIWNYKNFENIKRASDPTLIGMAGNINDRTDLDLLDYITKSTNYTFQLCGKVSLLENERNKLNSILKRENIEHLGYIPFNQLQQVVSKWDMGITIEGFKEYTRFTHHNKVYQYLALGIPVVTLKIHSDYEHLNPCIQTVENYSDFVRALDMALLKSRDVQFQNECVSMAKENSADKRAKLFLKYLKEL